MSKRLFFLDKDFRKLYDSIVDIIRFCWDENGWVGTETIRKSGKFLELAANLYENVKPFSRHLVEMNDWEENWQDYMVEPSPDELYMMDRSAESLLLELR